MTAKRKLNISIFIIWLFNISGIIGIFVGYKDWFLSLTWLHLLIYLFLILWNNDFKKTVLLSLLIPFAIGMIAEYLGVHYGLIFGEYAYGENLGPKVYGVPYIIGVNWAILTYCTAALSRRICRNIILSSVVGATFMVLLDMIIEVSAPKFDYWRFKNDVVPIQNYLGWFFTAFIAHILLQKIVKVFRVKISLHIFIAILVFFTVFLIF